MRTHAGGGDVQAPALGIGDAAVAYGSDVHTRETVSFLYGLEDPVAADPSGPQASQASDEFMSNGCPHRTHSLIRLTNILAAAFGTK